MSKEKTMLIDDVLPGVVVLMPREVYDDAIIGYSDKQVVYDMNKVIECGVEIFGTIEASAEWHDHNTFSIYTGPHTPMFITMIDD